MALYKYMEHEGKKYPVRISNCVLGEFQEESNKTDLKKMTFRDVRILMWNALKEGYEFADKEFDLTTKDVKLMVDSQKTVENFLLLLPDFFPPPNKSEAGGEALGKPK